MKRKYHKDKKSSALQKKLLNPTLDSFFRINTNNKYNSTSTKRSPSPLTRSLRNSAKKLCIIRNPSKSHLKEDSQQILKKYHEKAQKTILCDKKIIDNLYDKLQTSFDKLNRFFTNNKKYQNKALDKKELLIKFLLQLKYIDISYISPIFLEESFNEELLSQNLKDLIGYEDSKKIYTSYFPHNINECQIFWPNITEIITKYLSDFHEGKGLFIYAEDDYLSYLNKIKLLCNLNNYETTVLDESNQMKCMILDKLSEAMKTKRLPSISDSLGNQILMLEEMVNSFSHKWEIFSKNIDINKEDKTNKNNENIDNFNTVSNNISNLNNSSDLSGFRNNISSLSITSSISDISSNEKIKFTSRDMNIIYEEKEHKSKNSSSSEIISDLKSEEKNNIDDINKIDFSTNETIFHNFKEKINNKKNSISIDDIKKKEANNKFLLSNKYNTNIKTKSTNKSKDKIKNNARNRSSEYIKRKNKKNENDINNTDIKGYFRENTKEHKLFTQLQNNLFLYCTKAKTAIIIADSFLEKEIDKRYFNNILIKIAQTKCPIIILSNNLEYVYNSQQKKIKNLKINCILSSKNKRDDNIIYLYYFVIYINAKLLSLKFNKNIETYEKLFDYINNINIGSINLELCLSNLKHIYNLSEYFCFKGKFQIDIIDLRLSEIFLELEKDINDNIINSNDFNDIIEYLYNKVFPDRDEFLYYNKDDDKNIEELFSEYEMKSFINYTEGIKENLVDKIYKKKLNLNVSYDYYFNTQDPMINMEGLLLDKYFNNNNLKLLINNTTNFNNKLIFNNCNSFDETINNKIINKIQKEDRLFLSNSIKIFIPLSSLYNYVYPICRIWIIKKNKFNNSLQEFSNLFRYKHSEEQSIFIDVHALKRLIHKIENNFFLYENNIDYASNYILQKFINQKKINANFYVN